MCEDLETCVRFSSINFKDALAHLKLTVNQAK